MSLWRLNRVTSSKCREPSALAALSGTHCTCRLGLHAHPHFRVSVVGPYSHNPEMNAQLQAAQIPVYEFDLASKGQSIPTLVQLIHLIRRERVDLIHTHLRNADLPGIVAGMLTRIPVITTLHGRTGPLWGDYVPLRSRAIKRLHSTLLRYGTRRVIAISNFVKQFNMTDLHLPAAKFSVIHNASEVDRFEAVHDTAALRRALGIAPSAPVIALVGGLSRQKGVDHFLHMARHVLDQRADVRFLIVGAGEGEAEFKTLAHALHLNEAVIFTGWRPDVPALLHLSDLLVMTARDEGFGRVLTEAMAAAKPVVAFAAGAVPEVVVDGETGFLVNYGDVAELSARVLRLLTDRALAAQMGAAGRARLLREFSIERFVAHHVTLFNEILAHA